MHKYPKENSKKYPKDYLSFVTPDFVVIHPAVALDLCIDDIPCQCPKNNSMR
jgi:hypothetical protein